MNYKARFAMVVGSAVFSMSTWAADTCNGLSITGVIKDQKATVTIKIKNALVPPIGTKKNTADAVTNAASLTLVSGNITKGTIESAECTVVAAPNGMITSVTIKGANLTDAWIDRAIVNVGGDTVPDVNGVNGKITGIDVENASVVTSLNVQKDPLSLSGSSEIVTLSSVGGTSDKPKIKQGTKLHFQSSDSGTYTLYTTRQPNDCYGLPDLLNRCHDNDDAKDKTFSVTASELENKIVVRRWTTGVLIVPYKYGIANHSLASGSVTLGPYLGYSTDLYGTESTFALSAGITNVLVPTKNADGTVTNVNKQGLSVAAGFIFKPIKDSPVTAGFLLGVDQLGKDSQYQDNGKLWLGLYVGAGFGN